MFKEVGKNSGPQELLRKLWQWNCEPALCPALPQDTADQNWIRQGPCPQHQAWGLSSGPCPISHICGLQSILRKAPLLRVQISNIGIL